MPDAIESLSRLVADLQDALMAAKQETRIVAAERDLAMAASVYGCARLESEARIVGDSLVISIRISTLAHAARESDCFWRSKEAGFPLAINDEAAFAKSVRRGLNRESEDGSTPITRLLDDTTEWVCDQGEDGVEEIDAAAALVNGGKG